MSRSSASSIRTSDDRQVAGDAVRPEAGGAPLVPREPSRRRPQGPVREEDPVGEALEEMRLVGLDAEVVELDLGLGPRQGGRPLEGRRTRGTCRRGRGPRRATPRRRSRTSHAAVVPGASRTRQRRLKIGSSTAPTVFESGRPSRIETGVRIDAAAAEEAGAVGLVLDDRRPSSSSTATTWAAQIGRSSRDARPARREERVERRGRTRSGRTGSGRPGGRRRPPAARARSRRRT